MKETIFTTLINTNSEIEWKEEILRSHLDINRKFRIEKHGNKIFIIILDENFKLEIYNFLVENKFRPE